MRLLAGLVYGDCDQEVVRFGDVRLSRDALVGAATAVANEIGGASIVAVYADKSLATVTAVVGSLIAGVPIVPVPPDAGPIERHHVLRDSGAVAFVGTHPWDDVELPTVPVDMSAQSAASYPEPKADDVALVMYTSGTTGPPKGVLISHQAIANDLAALVDAWGWSPSDVLVHGLPLFHVHGLVLGVLGSLFVGNRFVHTGRPTPEAYAAARGTLYFGVPTVWARLCDDPESARALRSARLLVSGSAPLPLPVFDRLMNLTGHAPVERYGMTETLITVSVRHDGERRPGWVGVPVSGVETRLGNEEGHLIPSGDDDTVGELHVRGPTLFTGYLGRKEATVGSFTADSWFRTGDAAIIDSDGYHRIVGRQSSDIIKTGGHRVGAAEVESTLLSHPAVREAAVVGAPDDDLGERIVAFVVAAGVSEVDLMNFVATQLSNHKRPRGIRFVDSLPRNSMGKVIKSALTASA